jgi:hypothetical protein
MALRLEDVQPPKTAATQSLLISFWAFSAKTVGSRRRPHRSARLLACRTPPSALISSTASLMESGR